MEVLRLFIGKTRSFPFLLNGETKISFISLVTVLSGKSFRRYKKLAVKRNEKEN